MQSEKSMCTGNIQIYTDRRQRIICV